MLNQFGISIHQTYVLKNVSKLLLYEMFSILTSALKRLPRGMDLYLILRST